MKIKLRDPEKPVSFPVPNEKCCGCFACGLHCPSGAIEKIDTKNTKKRKIIWHHDKCISCGNCSETCRFSDKGVFLIKNGYELYSNLRKPKREKEFDIIICERCNTIMGSARQIETAINQIGTPAVYNTPALILYKSISDGLDPGPPKKRKHKSHRDRFMLLCQKCIYEVQKQ